jgi:PleD family two-component response regulator
MPRPQDKELILIVEDDRDISEMLCTYLRTKQYRMATTPMGEDVLDICRRERPSLVLLDINLPDIDGYEVCRRLRDNLATSNLPVIFLTRNKSRESKLTGFQTGGSDYITKPFDMEELYLRISNAIRLSKYRAGVDSVSGLPSGPLVEEQLKTLLYRDDWAVLLVSVEGFRHFERTYGHLRDKFASYVAQLVRDAVDQVGNFEDFVGRVDTVQYIIITTMPRIPRLRQRMERVFARVMNPPVKRNGAKPVTAYLGLSFGVTVDRDGPFGDVRSLAEAVAQSRERRDESA